MKPWKDSQELLDLFSIPRTAWSDKFCALCDMGAISRRFGGSFMIRDISRSYMSACHISPLVYWSNMKRAVRPLLDAGGDTLRALGLPIVGDPMSCVELVQAVVDVTYQQVPESDYVIYQELLELMGRV